MTQSDAIAWAKERKLLTGLEQVVYESQPGHFLWCSMRVYSAGQFRLTPKLVEVI
jgi:hypothetical protein